MALGIGASVVGGIFGVIFGSILAKLVEFAAANMGAELLKAALTPELIIGALLSSFIIGALSGALPALKASKLNSIEAISHG